MKTCACIQDGIGLTDIGRCLPLVLIWGECEGVMMTPLQVGVLNQAEEHGALISQLDYFWPLALCLAG